MVVELDEKESEHIRTILSYYMEFKRLTLHFEERYNTTFPPAVIGTRDALDHLMRSFQVKMGMNGSIPKDKESEYVISNLIASQNHIYRAMFELLDVMTAINRKKITDIVSEYSNETLTVHIPLYYAKIRQFLILMEKKVEDYRRLKDIANIDMDDVDAYIEEVKKLENYATYVESCVPQMAEYEKESKRMISQNLTAIEHELNSSRRLNYVLGALTVISLLFAVFGFLG